jgi:hypothetical protein
MKAVACSDDPFDLAASSVVAIDGRVLTSKVATGCAASVQP